MVSKFLPTNTQFSNLVSLYRWDALFLGEYRAIDDSRKPPDKKAALLASFHQRPFQSRNQSVEIHKLDEQMKNMKNKIRFGLWSGYDNAYSGRYHENKQYFYGITMSSIFTRADLEQGAKTYLSIELLQPLLRADLTDFER